VSDEESELTARDYFLLGTLAERSRDNGRFLRRYTEDEVERLVQGGYLAWERFRAPDGSEAQRYCITEKGLAAWQGYRFTGPQDVTRED
jgi:hypothetical protein